jgi:dUTP pyrophosphatase
MLKLPVKIVLLRHAPMPEYKTAGATGCDLHWICTNPITTHGGNALILEPHETKNIPLGIVLEIPEDYEGQIRPRSGQSRRGLLVHVGTIDPDYRGEVCATVTNLTNKELVIEHKERICQLVIAPKIRADFIQAQELSTTARGAGGFGSTGK